MDHFNHLCHRQATHGLIQHDELGFEHQAHQQLQAALLKEGQAACPLVQDVVQFEPLEQFTQLRLIQAPVAQQ